jgi:hypothetical protein
VNYREVKLTATILSIGIAFLLCFSQATTVSAQPKAKFSHSDDQRRAQHFEKGEELVYEAEFSRAVLRNIDVADFRFTSKRVASNSATASPTYSLKFDGEIKSKGFFSRLFNLTFVEQITSIVEPETFAVQNTKKFDQQGKRVRSSETVYDQKTGQIVWTERDPRDPSRQPRVVSAPLPEQVQDILSAIYFLRTQKLEVGQSFKITVTDSGRVYEIPVRVAEKKRLKTVIGKVDVVRADVDLFGDQSIIASKGEFSVWLTADERHIPVRARVKHEYGTFEIKLKKHSQLTAA